MENYVAECEKKAEQVLASMSIKIEALSAFLNTSFSSAAQSSQLTSSTKVICSATQNADMVAILSTVRSHLLTAMSDLHVIERWIVLLVPKAEDGNNFGVEVQKYVLTTIKAMYKSLETTWSSLPDYFSQRGAAVEKAIGGKKESNDVSKTVTQSLSKGGKDGDEDKSSDVNVTKTSTVTSTPIEDYNLQVNAIDIKWYFDLMRATESIVDNYAIATDILTKNDNKVRLPRGNKGGGHHSMF